MRKEYMPLIKCGHSPYEESRKWHKPITRSSKLKGVYTNKDLAMMIIKEALDKWNGKPINTPREKMSAKMAKEMMITGWKIKVRQVSDWEEVENGCIEYDESFADGDPKEDWFTI